MNDYILENNLITVQQYECNQEIIRKAKAFFMVNIPWDGYWRLKFLYKWNKPQGVSKAEFAAEKKLITNNIKVKPEDIINKSILSIFNEYSEDISYTGYLEEEEIAFEKNVKLIDGLEFGVNKKKDSTFPYLNYLSGESYDEFRPEPTEQEQSENEA